MKELKMFPQITEETEENLLNLEDEPKSPYSSTPPLNPSSSSESPPDAPSSPNHENQVPCHLPTITAEDVDHRTGSPQHHHHQNPPAEEEYATTPSRTRMRSLSGGSYRLASTLPSTGRHRRQSGDDVLTRVSPSRRATLFDQFRPRSKSDSKGKKPTFLTTLKNSLLGGGSVQRKTSLDSDPPNLESLQPPIDYRQRPRSGSETKGGTMSKMIDLFRNRSHSVSYDSKGKMVPPVLTSNSNEKVKRRVKRPYVNTYRSFDGHKGDSYGCHSEDETGERFDYGNLDDDKIIPSFLSLRTCYEAMPKSGKVVLLSPALLVKNAFSSLVTNEIRAAPLWDSYKNDFIGMLTISDFISVLRHYYHSSQDDIKDIENQKISKWKELAEDRRFVFTTPDDNLVHATKLLIEQRVHRLPVYDETRKSVLFLLSRRRLLNYLYNNLIDKFKAGYVKTPAFWNQNIAELKSQIGTWENIATVSVNTKVIDALDLFFERQVSSLPVMDEDGRLKDIFEKFDVFALAKEQTYDNLDMTVQQALAKAEIHHESACVRELNNPLGTVIEKFVTAKAHRLLFLDEKDAVIGILSLSDILKFLVLQPLVGDSAIPTAVIDETPEGAVGGPDDSSVFLESGQEPSGSLQKSSSLDKQDSSDLSEDVAKLQLEAGTPEPLSEPSVCEDEP